MLPGLMNTLASVSPRSVRSAAERGGMGRNAKSHQTQMKSRELRIDRESRKQPAKLMTHASPMPATMAAPSPVVAEELGDEQVQANACQHEDDGEREPGCDQAEDGQRREPAAAHGVAGGCGAASKSAARASIRSHEYCLISAE